MGMGKRYHIGVGEGHIGAGRVSHWWLAGSHTGDWC